LVAPFDDTYDRDLIMRHLHIASVAIAGILIPALVFASETAGHGEHHFEWGRFALSWVNFLILLGILIWLLAPKLKIFFSERSKIISDKVHEAEQLKAESRELIKKYQDKLTDFDKNKEEELTRYRADAQREHDEIIEAAQQRIKKMETDMELSIETKMRMAKEGLRKEIADAVTEEAQKILLAEIKPDDDLHLVNQTIDSIGGGK